MAGRFNQASIELNFRLTAPISGGSPVSLFSLLSAAQKLAITNIPLQGVGTQCVQIIIVPEVVSINLFDADAAVNRLNDYLQTAISTASLPITGDDALNQYFVRSTGAASTFQLKASFLTKV